MKSAPAYALAILAASVIVMLELVVSGWAHRWVAGDKVDSLWVGISGVALLVPIIFFVGLVISLLPFLVFSFVYVRLPDWIRLPAAMLFGVIVAFLGLWATLGTLNWSRSEGEVLRISLLVAPLPGLVAGWVFHKVGEAERSRVRETVAEDLT